MIKRFLAGALCVASLLSGRFTLDCHAADAVSDVRSTVEEITAVQLENSGSTDVQSWINGALSDNAGTTSEWYAIALSQSGDYNFSAYISALHGYLETNSVASATSREKYALALAAVGDTDNPYITEALESSVGQQGIMSCIYGLHIINNGYSTANFNAETVVSDLLSRQLSDGGWAVMGTMGDIDVTAMAVQSLAPYYNSDTAVKSAVNSALDLLSSRQENDGGYRSFGTANPESTAQVIVALTSLGIDPAADGRFVKGSNTLFDGIMEYQLADGTFSHTLGGESNATSTVQVFYSFVSYLRMTEGKTPLFIFDSLKAPETPTGNTNITVPTNTDISHSGGTSRSDGAAAQNGEASQSSNSAASEDSSAYAPSDGTDPDISQSDVSEATAHGTALSPSATTSSAVSLTVTTTAKTLASKLTTTSLSAVQQTSSDSAATSGTPLSTATSAISAELTDDADSESGGYKIWVVLGVIVTGGLVSGFLFAAGKRNYKNFIAVGTASAVIIAVVLATDIRSKDDYYNGTKKHKENAVGTVTMTIRCDTIAGISESKYVPKDAVILDVTEFDIEQGETVYDILTEAAQTYGIHTENSGGADFVYISGINYIYELEYGDLSGWMYYVNGKSPSVSCDEYVLSDGDRIEWLYTCNIGNDLKQEDSE